MGKSHLQFNRDNKPGICYLKSVLGFWCNMSLFTAVNFLNIKLIIAWLVHKTWTFMFWCSLYQLNPKDSQKLFLGFSLTQNFAWREKYQLAGSENKILPPTIFLQSHFSSWGVQTSKFSLKAWHARSRDMHDTWHARHVICTTCDMHVRVDFTCFHSGIIAVWIIIGQLLCVVFWYEETKTWERF